jgi:D-glycero-alpha-D-manno-heptose-7-phosphate kinase
MQSGNITAKKEKSIDAMHKLKEQAVHMKEAILQGNLNEIGELLNFGWQFKKQTAEGISNPMIDEIYEAALQAGANGGKISGAGGPGHSRYAVLERLHRFGGEFRRFQFINTGVTTWTTK